VYVCACVCVCVFVPHEQSTQVMALCAWTRTRVSAARGCLPPLKALPCTPKRKGAHDKQAGRESREGRQRRRKQFVLDPDNTPTPAPQSPNLWCQLQECQLVRLHLTVTLT